MPPSPTRTYCLISPSRNEADYLQRTLESVVHQTVPPTRWIIVDDGSTDGSTDILRDYAARYEFIQLVHRENRGRRSVGPGVIEAFYTGYAEINPEDYTYLGKLDLDLDLPPRYFERLIERMEADPRLGTCSGKPYYHDARGRFLPETAGDEMSVGMTKFYRRECFEQIGGFVRQVMWDGIDCHRCRMLGWKAASFDEPDLRFEHLRPMGASDKSILKGRMRHGYGQYFMGTSLPYITASALYRIKDDPPLLGAAAIWLGYVLSALRREPRLDDPAFRRFLRRFQWRCLMKGKRRTIAEIERNEQADRMTRGSSSVASAF